MLGSLAAAAPAAATARIIIINGDGPSEGFDDPTPAAPVGGNPGTTKGQQRLIAFQYAAGLWGLMLDSTVEVRVLADFAPLGANVLGSAGATAIFSDFPGVSPRLSGRSLRGHLVSLSARRQASRGPICWSSSASLMKPTSERPSAATSTSTWAWIISTEHRSTS